MNRNDFHCRATTGNLSLPKIPSKMVGTKPEMLVISMMKSTCMFTDGLLICLCIMGSRSALNNAKVKLIDCHSLAFRFIQPRLKASLKALMAFKLSVLSE